MNKTLLIFRHEFMSTIRRKGFIIMTLIVPLVAILGIVIYQVASGAVQPSEEITKIGYVDKVGGFEQYTTQGNISLVKFETVEEANASLIDKDIDEYIVIDTSYLSMGTIDLYTLKKQLHPSTDIISAVKNFLSGNLLSGEVPDTTIDLINAPLNMLTTRLTETGAIAEEQGGLGDLLIPMIFAFLLIMSIIFSSSYLLQGLVDEKENRLIEILISSVSTRQLIVGKVLGLGSASLLQVVVWVICAPLILNLGSSLIGGFFSELQLSPGFLILCIVLFILAYLLYAIISTGIGAVSSSTRDAQQFAWIFSVFPFVPFWFSALIIELPNNPFCIVLTLFPLTGPVTLIFRLGATEIPAWQIAASIVILVLTVVGGLLLTTKIVRTFLLMYGKRPKLGEIIRNIRSG